MKIVKVSITINVKSDPDDEELLLADIREAIGEAIEDGTLDYSTDTEEEIEDEEL